MDETILEKMLHSAADLRARLDGPTMTTAQRAFLQHMLRDMEAAFRAQPDLVRAIRAGMPRRDNEDGRATVAYVDRLLGERNGVRLH